MIWACSHDVAPEMPMAFVAETVGEDFQRHDISARTDSPRLVARRARQQEPATTTTTTSLTTTNDDHHIDSHLEKNVDDDNGHYDDSARQKMSQAEPVSEARANAAER